MWAVRAITAVGDLTGEGELGIGEQFENILEAASAGVPWAFERLYADLAPSVAGYLRAQRAPEPDDLTSEVFLAVFQGLATFEGSEAGFRSWVFTIAHRRLIDVRRRMARRPWTEIDDSELPDRPGGDVEKDAFDLIGSRQVQEWCSGLPEAQREVLLLRVVGDLTVEQVAATVGRSPGAVKALQRRALAALRRRLEREGVPL